MRVSFSSATMAQAAVKVLETYGYSAMQLGRDVVTDCPTLLAVPAIQKRVGLAEVERLDLTGRDVQIGSELQRSASTDDLPAPARAPVAPAAYEMTA
jgi:hypothetical protein